MKAYVTLVEAGTAGCKKAAKIFDVKWQTVRDHVKKRYQKMGAGRPTALTTEEEGELATYLKLLSRWGFGMTRKETLEVVGEYVKNNGKDSPFVDGVPGDDWLTSFMQRHRELAPRLPEQLKAPRSKTAANKSIITKWFELVNDALTEHHLHDKPERIYNADESGFPLDP